MTRALLCLSMAAAVLAQQVEVAATLSFTEGPAVDRDGNVYFTEIVNQRIMKLTPAGAMSVWRENSNVANGLLIDDTVIHPAAHVKTRRRLEKWGIKEAPVDVSEVLKAEGGVTCCSLVFDAEQP